MGSNHTQAMRPSPTTDPTILGPTVFPVLDGSIPYHGVPILGRGRDLPNFARLGGPGHPFAPGPQSGPRLRRNAPSAEMPPSAEVPPAMAAAAPVATATPVAAAAPAVALHEPILLGWGFRMFMAVYQHDDYYHDNNHGDSDPDLRVLV